MMRAAWIARAKDRLIASDPGLIRLQLAARATLTVMLASWVLSHAADDLGQPMAVAFIGIVAAMMSSQAIADPTRRGRQVTFLLLPLPASVALTAGTWLAPS